MDRRARAFTVAAVAAGLLIVVLAVDTSMARSVHLDVQQDGEWMTVGADSRDRSTAQPFGFGMRAVQVDPNGTLDFRVRMDNGYPWEYREPFRVMLNGVIIAEGALEVPGRSTGEARFTVEGRTLLESAHGPRPARDGGTFVSLELMTGSTAVYATLNMQEKEAE